MQNEKCKMKNGRSNRGRHFAFLIFHF
jgi:hypothetical protein